MERLYDAALEKRAGLLRNAGHLSEEGVVTTPFTLAFTRSTRFGVLAGVHLPPERAEFVAPPELLARLHESERSALGDARGHRLVDFIGGRIACRAALNDLGVAPRALTVGERGAPELGDVSLTVSVSHKPALALALVAHAKHGTVGVDLEGGDGRARPIIAPKVLGDDELALMRSLPEAEQWPFVQRRFAIKEAVYKAIHPHLRRYVGFHEAHVAEDERTVQLKLPAHEPALRVEVFVEQLEADALIAFARAVRLNA